MSYEQFRARLGRPLTESLLFGGEEPGDTSIVQPHNGDEQQIQKSGPDADASKPVKVESKITARNPNYLPPEDLDFFQNTLGMAMDKRIKRGRYGVVLKGHFTNTFSVSQLVSHGTRLEYFNFKEYSLTKVGHEHLQSDEPMSPFVEPPLLSEGQPFAIKFCDIEGRRAFGMLDIEEKVKAEVALVRGIDMALCPDMVKQYFVLATSPWRYYFVMEVADNNLQCIINEVCRARVCLDPVFVLGLYEQLVRALRAMHQQRWSYGMMRTSNVLVFNESGDTPVQAVLMAIVDADPSLNPDTRDADGKQPTPEDKSKCEQDIAVPPTAPPTPEEIEKMPTFKRFQVKLADFVRSVNLAKLVEERADELLEQDMDDLFYIHYEIFAMTRFKFSKYQDFKDELRVMTATMGRHDSVIMMDKVIAALHKFASQQSFGPLVESMQKIRQSSSTTPTATASNAIIDSPCANNKEDSKKTQK